MPRSKILLRILINSFLGLALAFVWSRFVNLGEVGRMLKTVQLRFALVFFGLFFLSGVLKSLRFKLLLKKYKLPFKDVLMLNFLSQFLSFVIPIRAGEATKGVYLTTQFGLPLGKAFVWVFVDRFLDFWITLLLINIFLIFTPTALPVTSVKVVFFLFLLFSLVFAVAVTSELFFKKITRFLSGYLVLTSIKKMFVTLTDTIVEGVGVLRRPLAETTVLMVLSIIAILVDSLVWMIIFFSLGTSLRVDQTILGTTLTALTFLIPAAPGYVGSAEAAGLAVFGGALGLPADLVSAAAVLFHILTLVTILVLGLTSLYILKFDLGIVWKKLRKQETD